MKLIHDGQIHPFTLESWLATWESRPNRREWMEVLAREGTITTDQDVPLSGPTLKRLRARMLHTYAPLPFGGRRRQEPRWLIPGLWPWGTIPAMNGNWKAGKTTVVTDLGRALVVPGYRFLDQFEPAELSREERRRGVVVINAETPPGAFEAALHGVVSDEAWKAAEEALYDPEDPDEDAYWTLYRVDHLEQWGGAHWMDLTNPDVYGSWVLRLVDCYDCDGTDDVMPHTVVVDGVTAILQAAGKSPEDFGYWYAKFRQLLRECDVPNGLATGHSTMAGGHLMGGTAASAGPDGLWTFSSDRTDDPRSPRRFSVQPRMGGVVVPPTRVLLDQHGRPVVQPSKAIVQLVGSAPPEDAPEPVAAESGLADRIAEYVRQKPGVDGQEITDRVANGGKGSSLEGRAKAVELGLVREEKCGPGCSVCSGAGIKPHHIRRHYWPVV